MSTTVKNTEKVLLNLMKKFDKVIFVTPSSPWSHPMIFVPTNLVYLATFLRKSLKIETSIIDCKIKYGYPKDDSGFREMSRLFLNDLSKVANSQTLLAFSATSYMDLFSSYIFGNIHKKRILI